jgi:hypothetical protein
MDRAQARERLPQVARWCSPLALVLGVVLPCAAANETWKFDVLRLKNGGTMTGIVLEEDTNSVWFLTVQQRPGEKTYVGPPTEIKRNEIGKYQLLSRTDRAVLRDRLEKLDRTGKGELARMEEIVLKNGSWLPGITTARKPRCYTSDHFVLISNANEEIIRRVAVRLEDIYSAYTRFLPPRINKGKKTEIYLVRSPEEYLAIVKKQGRNILNPAFFDTAENQILVRSELEKLGEELGQRKQIYVAELEKIANMEAGFRKEFPKGVPFDLRKRIYVLRDEVHQAIKKDEARFTYFATEQFYQTLQHEAFHAYLANFVYQPEKTAVPRWLNEGLAQIFETAIFEAGEVRVGHVDKDRFTAIKEAVSKKQLLDVPVVLKSQPKDFLVAHAAQKQVSDQYYLNSWALAYYLTFERRLLGTRELDQYVKDLKRGVNETEAFQTLVNRPIGRFEREYQAYLTRLKADGTLVDKKPQK